jgi:hypothetical protein
MVWYIAIIAIVNLALGYALAVLLGDGRNKVTTAGGDLMNSREPAEF